jgi:imidazole glycerol-phosphate synthase subunit HisF
VKNLRIIPRLDIKGPNLVKGIHLEGLRVLGKPDRFAKYYYEQGADELLYMDVVASLYGRNSLLDIISRTSKETFIPLTVGGGIRTIEDMRAALCAGADKISLNTAAIHQPQLVQEAARMFGSSTILISIEATRQTDGSYEAFTDNGRERTGIDAIAWAKQVEDLGAGEIMITSIDREGTGLGFDLELTKQIATQVSVPVIACGGAGKMGDIHEAVIEGRADAVSLGSMLHYELIQNVRFEDNFSTEGNVKYLNGRSHFGMVETISLNELKQSLSAGGIPCRIEEASA